MTHDEMIAVIQAHREGKNLQYRDVGDTEWLNCIKPYHTTFNFSEFEYRINPRKCPREWSLLEVNCGSSIRVIKPGEILPFGVTPSDLIRVREVIE